jgi:nucleotide-binding universal stress UspA family protein
MGDNMFDRILAAVDGSESGMEALKMAIELQKSYHSELLILTVYREHDMWKASVSMVNPELTGSTDAALMEYAKGVVLHVPLLNSAKTTMLALL